MITIGAPGDFIVTDKPIIYTGAEIGRVKMSADTTWSAFDWKGDLIDFYHFEEDAAEAVRINFLAGVEETQ